MIRRREFITLLGGASKGGINGEKKSARRVSARCCWLMILCSIEKCAMVAAARSVS